MDLKRAPDGSMHIRLGPVEKIGVAAAFALLVFLLGYVFHSFDGRMEGQEKSMKDQKDAMGTLVTQQAVTNAQLQTLSQQLSDVPGLTRQVVEIKVQTERNTQDIHELQQVRKLK